MTNWTTTPPAEPGWYWYRDFKDSVPEPVRIYEGEIETLSGEWWPERIQEPGE